MKGLQTNLTGFCNCFGGFVIVLVLDSQYDNVLDVQPHFKGIVDIKINVCKLVNFFWTETF